MLDHALVLGTLHPLAHLGLDEFGVLFPAIAMMIIDVDIVNLEKFEAIFQVCPPFFSSSS